MKRTRSHRTRWTVRAADRIAAVCISIGGIGTVIAVSAVFLFLASVVVPLLAPGTSDPAGTVTPATPARILHLGVDEYRTAAWTLSADGAVRVFRLDTGDTVATRVLVPADSVAVSSFDEESGTFAIGRVDGSVRVGRIDFRTDFPALESIPGANALTGVALAVHDGAVVQRTPDGSLRRQTLLTTVEATVDTVTAGPARAIDHVAAGSGYFIAAVPVQGPVVVCHVDREENDFTGEVTLAVDRGILHADATARVDAVLFGEAGSAVFVFDADGTATVWDTRDVTAPSVSASASVADETARVSVVAPLIGRSTVIVGRSDGMVSTWFRYAPDTEDGSTGEWSLARSRAFRGAGAAVTALSPSVRERVFLAGYADGTVRVLQATSGKRVIDFDTGEAAVDAVAFAPKNDGLIALAGGAMHNVDVDLKHPEATLRGLFLPVWYEGYAQPEHVWQSSAGTDDFEPKLGLWPLVFGTLKATFYSMLFGVPLALLAAIFTSEFVSPAVRPRLKTLIESMASLPSVVLGFLAALVIAPFVQRTVPTIMVAFVTIPFVLLGCAYLWQALPQNVARRLDRFRLPIALAALPVAVLLAAALGPWTERAFFGGDVMAWLAGGQGIAFGGWFLLLLPVSAALVIFGMGRITGDLIRELASRSTRARVAGVDLARFVAGTLLTLVIAALAAAALDAMGLDARGGLMGTYVQRNALVVGFVMGFAIIPIIYTIAEDALSAVPDHLRAASLGAGATPWQTAIRIVLPTAMSGLFSAIMIGLGRAVGETMIVLMAAGNTPVLEMNIFNGFRTLSANIAVELPEAVRDSTHYRTLFLAALLLFLMTFVINTVAEIVRLRFRKRSAQI